MPTSGDWTLWLLAKRLKGQSEHVTSELHKMFSHILRPMGVDRAPASLETAVASYLVARDRLERDWSVTVPRALECEVVRVLGENRESPSQ